MNILAAMQRWITRWDQSFLGALRTGVTGEFLVCCRLLILRLFCSLLSMSTPIEAIGDDLSLVDYAQLYYLLFYETKSEMICYHFKRELGILTVVNFKQSIGEEYGKKTWGLQASWFWCHGYLKGRDQKVVKLPSPCSSIQLCIFLAGPESQIWDKRQH